ncbi:hypothetical protein WJ970_00685 [Achromobacter xylosoxidans]
MATDLTKHYVLLNPDGASITTQGGNAFWSQSPDQLDAYGEAGWCRNMNSPRTGNSGKCTPRPTSCCA